jgi:hypothetical protein
LKDYFNSDAASVLMWRAEPVTPRSLPRSPLTAAGSETADVKPKKTLTGSAKFIAFYVFCISYKAFGNGLEFGSVHDIRRNLIVVTGLIGSVLLFRQSRRAKPFFTAWAVLIALGMTPFGGGPDGDPFVIRALTTFLGAFILLAINREVERNVTEDWEREDLDD